MLYTSEKILTSEPAPEPAVQTVSMASPRRAGRACPRCESSSVSRSRIRGVIGHALQRALGVRPYRCLDCWHRFMAWKRG